MLYGVNLGNWLVLEKWMDDTPFRGTDSDDEIWLSRVLPRDEFVRRLKEHRDTYITHSDFLALKAAGVKLVRLPVPYSVFGDRSPFPACIEYVDKAFAWAKEYDIKILLDLHTVPGSQNGFDNGGLSGVAKWHKSEKEILFALGVLERLGERYGHHQALYGIEVLNEPASWSVWKSNRKTYPARDISEALGSSHIPLRLLKRFYKAAYARLRRVIADDKIVVFHDGFRLLSWLPILCTEFSHMKNIAIDTHMYLSAAENVMPQWAQAVIDKCGLRKAAYKLFFTVSAGRMKLITMTGTPVIVGEWALENQLAKDERIGIKEASKLYHDAFGSAQVSAQFFWSYQLNRNEKKRVRMAQSWRRFWDWRMMKEFIQK